MLHQTRTVIELRIGSLDESKLRVRRMTSVERLSSPYSATVEFSPASEDFLSLQELLGAEATLTVRRPDGPERHWHGLLWRTEMTGVAAAKPSYRAVIVPKLERLKWAQRSQIYQGLSVPQIVGQVLGEHKIDHRFSLSAQLSPREYCVQYRESDFAFVSRLMEDEGLYYWFKQGSDSHVMVITDSVRGCAQLPGGAEIPFRTSEQVADYGEDEHLFKWSKEDAARTGKVFLKDFDFERPEQAVDGECKAKGSFDWESYEYPGGFTNPRQGSPCARLRLEQLRCDAERWKGESTCVRFFPGALFQVEEHEDPRYNQSLQLLTVEHHGEQQEDSGGGTAVTHQYRNRITAMAEALPFRPALRTLRPQAAAETATVVGPAGEEIWVDRYGRVKVQFHWDRLGKRNENSTCWMRVAQSWAGAAWGAKFVPRIGQEVLVKFLEGDPDRPLVVGAVYNGLNRPPIELPLHKTRSTVKSDSSLGSDGSNELRFEDAKDFEEIYLHAQKDEAIEIRNDKTQLIHASETLTVHGDRSLEVKEEQRLEVEKDEVLIVGSDQSAAVAGDRTVHAQAIHTENVSANQSIQVAGRRTVSVDGSSADVVVAAAALTIGGAYSTIVGAAMNTAVGGLMSRQVGAARIEVVGAARDEEVVKDSSLEVGETFASDVKGEVLQATDSNHTEEVSGKTQLEVAKSIGWNAQSFALEANKLSLVVGGKLILSIDKSGTIKFGTSSITLEGELCVKGASVSMLGAGSTSGASPTVKQLEPMRVDRTSIKIEAKDPHGMPLVNEPFRIELPDGRVEFGRLDGDGRARVPSGKEGDCKIDFPRLDQRAFKNK